MALRNVFFRNNFNRKLILYYSTKGNEQCGDLSWVPKDVEGHTGQKFEEDDYRLVRFMNKSKHVNPNWAIKLIAEVPPAKCTSRVVWCDGGGGPTGHPKVYINLDKPGVHTCNYCGLRFKKE